MPRRPAVFLDRDGTILDEMGYLSDPRRMRFYPTAFAALRKLRRAGFRLVVVTNQSGLGRGYFSMSQWRRVNAHFLAVLRARGVKIDGVYFCPHAPDAGCRCRKPSPTLPRRAARDLGLSLSESYVVGDQARDVALAQSVGARGVLVLTGHGRSARASAGSAARIAARLATAADWIVRDHARRMKR